MRAWLGIMSTARLARGMGRIGVIVALESKGDASALTAHLGRQIAMHIGGGEPVRAGFDRARPGGGGAREEGAGREERRQAGPRAGQDRRVGAEDLLQGSLPASIRLM